jgi:hypothetical protein
MPPRMMFRMSQRPKGLEFPSCGPCNQGTSRLDVVAAFMARTFPGVTNDADAEEWDKVMGEVRRIAPDLLQEMWVPRDEMLTMLEDEGISDPKLAAFYAGGPILGAHMQAFAAKVGFALHYEATGTVVPMEGRVQVRWYTSGEMVGDRLPSDLLSSVGTPQIMQQGKVTSKEEFEYGWGKFIEKPEVRLYYAKVREAFTIAAFVVSTEESLPFSVNHLATFSPGELATIPYDRIMEG